jgi:ATP-dependent DNA helicase RecG
MFENINTEFKSEHSIKVNKTLLAFINTDGGRLYLGISDDGRVVGIDNPDEEMLRVTHGFRDSVSPDPTAFLSATPIIRDRKTVIRKPSKTARSSRVRSSSRLTKLWRT